MGHVAHDNLPDAEKYCYSYLIVIFCNTAHTTMQCYYSYSEERVIIYDIYYIFGQHMNLPCMHWTDSEKLR